jgi:hypothetical protein
MVNGTTPCSLNDNTPVHFIYAQALSPEESSVGRQLQQRNSKMIVDSSEHLEAELHKSKNC